MFFPDRHKLTYNINSRMLKAAAERGVKVNVMVYKEVSGVLTTCSEHTKHALEALHQNIAVFRHPDHNPSARVISSEIISGFKNMSFSHASIASLPHDGLEKLYGLSDDVILYWAHHEKLCLIDGHTTFMGGLDLCYGRWDTHQHQTA
jgi:phospholipase D1/2